MTVADMTPTELYSVIVTAFVVCGFGLLGLNEWRTNGLETKRQKFVAAAGLFVCFGIPAIIGLRVMLAN